MMGVLRSGVAWAAAWIIAIGGVSIMLLYTSFFGRRSLFGMVRHWCGFVLRAVGIRVELVGEFPDHDPIIIVAPHVNLFDPLVLGSLLPRHIRGVELDTHFRWPLYGALIGRLGHLPISHATPQASRRSMRRAEELLAAGESLVVFPEGRRTRTGGRSEFGLWAFRLAAKTGTEVVPLAFDGAFERQQVGSLRIRPGVWRVTVLPIFSPAGADRGAAVALRDAVVGAIDGSRGRQ
jgi:1-acyl-sn-glycerol-3-phosphate acyltransferase